MRGSLCRGRLVGGGGAGNDVYFGGWWELDTGETGKMVVREGVWREVGGWWDGGALGDIGIG